MTQQPAVEREWTPAGPVAQAYEFDRTLVSVCVGPTGGGKTTVSARRVLRAALWQHPSPRDGVRRARIFVVTPTYRIAHDSVIPSYLKVMDRGWGKFVGAKGDPCDHLIQTTIPKFGPVEIDVRFRAVQDMDLDEFFRGKECTAFWLPELDTHEREDILSYCVNRVGRFPEPDDRPENPPFLAYKGVWGDANAPIIDSWFDRGFFQGPRAGQLLHRQPPGYEPSTPDGFHPQAENAHNLRKLDPEYYRTLASRMEPGDVARLLQCKRGYGRFGQPVHMAFDEFEHVSKEPLKPDKGRPLLIGADAGLFPAATFEQCDYGGHWQQFAEVTCEQGDMDAIEHGRAIKMVANTRFAGCKEAVIFLDPSAWSRSALNKRLTYAQILQVESGIPVVPAPTNDTLMRIQAYDRALKRRHGELIDLGCTGTITALAGAYCYAKTAKGLSPKPKKDKHSAIADAKHYVKLGYEGMEGHGGSFRAMPGAGDQGQLQTILSD